MPRNQGLGFGNEGLADFRIRVYRCHAIPYGRRLGTRGYAVSHVVGDAEAMHAYRPHG